MANGVQIPLPTSSTEDTPQRGGAGKLINAMLELLPNNTVNRKRAPGTRQFSTSASGATHCRGMILVNSGTLLAVYNDMVEAVLSNGTSTALGPIPGSGLVTLAKNNNSPNPDVVCVAGGIAYVLSTSGPPAAYPDVDVGSPNSVCFGDGYFFFTYGSGAVLASGINATTINPLDAAQVNSSSTTLLRGIYFAQTLFLFTQDKIEAWVNTANPTDFPFSRSSVIQKGLINANAVAGHESEFAGVLIFAGSDHIVYMLNGYTPVRISTSDIERRLEQCDESTLRACVYMVDGHAIWQLTSSTFTLCYDITGSYWFERESNALEFSRIETSCYAFGSWLVGDYSTGKLGEIGSSFYSEYGEPLTYEVQSLPLDDFPKRRIIKRVDFNFVPGTGLPLTQTDGEPMPRDYASYPKVLVSWSNDGGASFGFPVERQIGMQGDFGHVVSVLRGGTASRYGRIWRVQVSDPVYVGLFGATMDVD